MTPHTGTRREELSVMATERRIRVPQGISEEISRQLPETALLETRGLSETASLETRGLPETALLKTRELSGTTSFDRGPRTAFSCRGRSDKDDALRHGAAPSPHRRFRTAATVLPVLLVILTLASLGAPISARSTPVQVPMPASIPALFQTRSQTPTPISAPISARSAPVQIPVPATAQALVPAPALPAPLRSAAALLFVAPADAAQGSVHDPLSPENEAYIRNFFAVWRSASTEKAHGQIPGWPLYTGGDWYMQYPPQWSVRDANPQFLWVSDPRGLTHFVFAQAAQVQGGLSTDDLRAFVFQKLVGGASPVLIAREQKNPLASLGLAGDGGLMDAAFIRWMHGSAGKMLTFIQITILARSPLYTSYQLFLESCPEAELVASAQQIFDPMIYSARFTIPNYNSELNPDTDGDGYADPVDADPENPQVW